MVQSGLVVISDRGGHLHNALMLVRQMSQKPAVFVLTQGPDTEALKKESGHRIFEIPRLFSWVGKRRLLNPVSLVGHMVAALVLVWRTKPQAVISLGASNVVVYCYFARLFGARIFHVECMNQVTTPSITGRALYPICEKLYVQWEDLLPAYGSKAAYAGWVL